MSKIPGPKPLPFIGSLHKLKKPPCLTFSKLAQTHGEVFVIKLGSVPHVILNSAESLRQAFGEQGEEFAYRKEEFTSFKIYREVRGEENVGITSRSSTSEVWKMQHEVIKMTMNHFIFDKESNRFENSIHSEATKLVTSWLGKDKEASCVLDPIDSFEKAVGKLKAACIIGENISGGIDNFDQRFEDYNEASVRMLALMRGGFINDFLPCLSFLAKSKQDQMREVLEVGATFLEDIFKTHQTCYQDGSKDTIMDCVVTFHDELEKKAPGQRSIPRKTVLGVISEFLEGVTNSNDMFFQIMMYMVYFPDVQEKVRDELMKVVGSSRLPSFDDRTSLPYTEAVIYEVCRHSSVINVTVPHSAVNDVILGGRYNMLIPKEALVIANLSAIHKDPIEWPNPAEFDPARFINEEGQLDEAKVKKCMIFSTGKRSCIAELLTRREMFLMYSSLVHLCKFENRGKPLAMLEIRGVEVPRDGSMKIEIKRTGVTFNSVG